MKCITLLLCFGLFTTTWGYGQQNPSDNTAVNPVPRDGAANQRYLMLNERVQQNQGEIDLLFIGDSITEGWEGEGREVWDEFYGLRKAVNIGISGDQTQHVLWRLDNGNMEGVFPKVAVIMIGTNNSGLDRNTTSEMLAGTVAVAERVREERPDTKILLLGIFPRGEGFNEQRGKITQVNQALKKLDDNQNIHFLDIGDAFIQSDGTISREIMPDALHLSPAGYRLWAEAMEPHIQKLLR